MGIPLGRRTRETVESAVHAVKDAASRTSSYIGLALGLSVLALCVAALALFRVRAAA